MGEVEITPKMVAAGIEALLACDREFDPPDQIVTEVFLAMAQAALPPTVSTSSDRR